MVETILRWRADLGLADQFCVITDNGSHFSNKLITQLSKVIGFEQTFTVAYSPWPNGSIETVNSQILKIIRSLTSQYGLHETEWPGLLPVIAYVLNNRPVSRRANLTPNKIFMRFRLEEPLIQKSRKHFAIKLQQDMSIPVNTGELLDSVDKFRSGLDAIQEKVYNSTLLKRDLDLSRKNKNRNVLLQYAPGDYVMVSEYGTQNAKEKTKPTWLGPYQVVWGVSNSVYEVESVMAKLKTVHASCMWFYLHRPPTRHPKLRSLFSHNYSSLEVSKIRAIGISEGHKPRYKTKVSWLGFERGRDTWQDLQRLYEDVPLMARNFVESKLEEVEIKTNILVHLEQWDTEKLDRLRKRGKKSKRNKKNKLNRVEAPDKEARCSYLKISPYGKEEVPATKVWYDPDKEILAVLIYRFGCGNYEAFKSSNYLPYRTKQQLSTQTQRLIGIQYIGIFHGLHFKPEKAKEFLAENFGIKEFHRNIPGKMNLIKEKEQILKQFKAEICASPEEAAKAPVSYFRRLTQLDHVNLLIAEFNEPECKKFLRNTKFSSKRSLEQLAEQFNAARSSGIRENEDYIELSYQLMVEVPEIWNDLSLLRTEVICRIDEGIPPMPFNMPFTYKYGTSTLSLDLKGNKIELTFLKFDSLDQVPFRFYYIGGNRYQVAGATGTFFLEPPNTKIMMGNVFDLKFDHPMAKKNIYTLLVMDPPWRAGIGDPTRGVTLPYPTISLQKFSQMQLPLNHFPFGTFLFIWVTNISFRDVLAWAEKQHYYISDEMGWIKRHPSGKLHKSLGYFLQHSQETCLVFERRSKPEVVYQNTFEEDNLKSFSNYFSTNPLDPSMKPDLFYRMLEETFPTRNKIEYFGRWNNIRCGWTTCGQDLIAPAQLSFLQHSRAATF
eukprot:augustus_masked-scaffold_7-processed-gene-8.4-mRNA-1 protein AED:0.45 eAED:0.45 QI:0/-1/0/1/-1/1/1/0/886